MRAVREVERKYYKYVDTAFEQSVLSSNGIMGGDSFACSGSSVYGSYYPYYAFDNTTKFWHSGQESHPTISWYNPRALKIISLNIQNSTDRMLGYSGSVQCSNDNSNWVTLKSLTFNSTLGASWIIDLSENTNYYKYYRIYIDSSLQSYSELQHIGIVAFYKEEVESTIADYDYYIDIPTYKLPKINNVYYGINQ